ncbi:MAG: hypothetical protein A3J28_06960 [Acidobacteria bacterium RIFCSPLOWO2_12_FULL_60_22]|nr:MAG: hypothetical protein A3J28_06960 [Acidobacteria bacterium RIFCSPLOWO2_12_FULL_60_22]
MKVNGMVRLKVARDQVWEALNNPAVLRRCTPGCKEMIPDGEDSYQVRMEVGVGSVKGRYKGTIKISDRVPGQQYKLTVTGTGSAGFVNAEGLVQLTDQEEETRIEYSGQAQVGGPVAGVGQRVIEGVAKFLVEQFFKCVESAILQSQAGERDGSEQS